MKRLYRTARVSLPREGIDDPAILRLVEEVEKQLRVIIGQVAGAPADSYTDGTVDTDALADDAVTQPKVDDDAIGTDEIIDANVTRDKLAANAKPPWYTADLDTDAVTKSNVDDEAIGRAELDTTENTFSNTFGAGGGQWTAGPITGGYVFWPDIYSDTGLTPFIIAQNTATPADSDNPYISLMDVVGNAVVGGSHRQVDA